MISQYAENELRLAGFFDEDADYNGMIPAAVLELLRVFENQGHSGASAAITAFLFNKLAKYEPLTPLTYGPDEWVDHTEENGGEPLWQNKRKSSVFSKDLGKTWYDIDLPEACPQKEEPG